MLSHSWLKLGVWFAENPETFLQYYWLVSYSLVVFMHLNFLFWALYLVFIEFKHSDFNPCFHLLTLLKSWLLLSWVFATYCSFNMTSILSCQLSKALKNILNAAYNESLHYVDWHLTIGQIIFGNFLVSALFFFFFSWIFKHSSYDVYLYQLSICDFASENGISNSIGTKCIVHQVSDQVLPFVSVETKVILPF